MDLHLEDLSQVVKLGESSPEIVLQGDDPVYADRITIIEWDSQPSGSNNEVTVYNALNRINFVLYTNDGGVTWTKTYGTRPTTTAKRYSLQDGVGPYKMIILLADRVTLESCDFGTSNVKITSRGLRSTSNMFKSFKCGSLDLSKADFSLVVDASSMFSAVAFQTPPDYSLLDFGNVTDMNSMFLYYTNTLPINTGNWNVSSVTSLIKFFYICTKTVQTPLYTNWDVSSLTNLGKMHSDSTGMTITPDVSKWNTVNLVDASGLLENCGGVKVGPNTQTWKMEKVENLYRFVSRTGFTTKLVNLGMKYWKIPRLNMALSFSSNVAVDQTEYEEMLIAWAAQIPNVQGNTKIDVWSSRYKAGSPAAAARAKLVAAGWVITGDRSN